MNRITEQRPVGGPLVYGYLRLTTASVAREPALTATLVEYCDEHELTLGAVFTERANSSVLSAAFAGLMDVLALRESYGVVVPSRIHLGRKPVAAQRVARITRTASRLLIVRPALGGGR